jgi:hypothetical protein
VATAAILAFGALVSHVPLPQLPNARLVATIRLGLVCVGCLVAAWPALYVTRSVTPGEGRMLAGMLIPSWFRPAPNV